MLLSMCRFASGLMYYGLVFNSPNLGSNPFVSYSISSIIDAPCLIPLLVLFTWVGRILPLSIGNFLGGVFFLLTIGMAMYMYVNHDVYVCGVWVRRLALDPVVMRSSPATGHTRCVLLVNQHI